MNYKQEAIKEFSDQVKAVGFRVFLAESGIYGFYTDEAGSRVVSFHYDLAGIHLSGNYKTSNPKRTGSGWGIFEGCPSAKDIKDAFDAAAPQWALSGATWRYTSLGEHLAMYQKSSKYSEA